LEPSGGFASFQERNIGLSGRSEIPTRTLADRAAEFSRQFGGTLVTTPFDRDHVTRAWGLCTGAGADSSTLREAAERGLDTLVVGEGPHHTAVEARDLGIVVLYAGHYATETLGVRALGETVAARFDVSSTFVDAPTGLGSKCIRERRAPDVERHQVLFAGDRGARRRLVSPAGRYDPRSFWRVWRHKQQTALDSDAYSRRSQ